MATSIPLHDAVAEPAPAHAPYSSNHLVMKRLLLDALPSTSLAKGLELGPTDGRVAATLAPHCRSLRSMQVGWLSAGGRRRLSRWHNVHITQGNWNHSPFPVGHYDLAVGTDLGRLMGRRALQGFLGQIRVSLVSGGTLIALHRVGSMQSMRAADRARDALRTTFGAPVALLEEGVFCLERWRSE